MSTMQATVQGYDVRVTIGRARAYGTNASALAFAPDSSEIVAETREITFLDHCPACIAQNLTARMMPWADVEDIAYGLGRAGYDCTCPCDCGDCDDCDAGEVVA